jgi:hypothetical protein
MVTPLDRAMDIDITIFPRGITASGIGRARSV